MQRHCLLDDTQMCRECGECTRCDLDRSKICDNCMQCIKKSDADYLSIEIDDVIEVEPEDDELW